MDESLGHRDWDRVRSDYSASAPYNFAILDDFLVPAACQALRERLLEDRSWARRPGNPCLLVTAADVALPMVDAITEVIRQRCTSIVAAAECPSHWAIMHADNEPGVAHWDRGGVILNLWLTPDEHNLDRESGGLVLLNAKRGQVSASYEQLRRRWPRTTSVSSVTSESVTIPYRYNRAVLFDAGTLHQTDSLNFCNRAPAACRMNLTICFEPRSSVDRTPRASSGR